MEKQFEFKHLSANEYYELQKDSIYNVADRRMFLFWDRGYEWNNPENGFDLVFSVYKKDGNILIGSFSLDKLNENHEYLLSSYIKQPYINNGSIFEDALKEFLINSFNNELSNKRTKTPEKIKVIKCYTLQDEGLLSFKLRKAGFKYKGIVDHCLCNYKDEWESGELYEIII